MNRWQLLRAVVRGLFWSAAALVFPAVVLVASWWAGGAA